MKKLTATLFVALIAIVAATSQGEAGWKKRGWYQKRPGANCVMRRVVVSGMNGKVVASRIRVCR